jgi:hypothetical protein
VLAGEPSLYRRALLPDLGLENGGGLAICSARIELGDRNAALGPLRGVKGEMSLDRMEGGMLEMVVYAAECLRDSWSGVSIDGSTDSFSSESMDPSASYGEGELPRSWGMLESESE